jgi:RecA-family ATPase
VKFAKAGNLRAKWKSFAKDHPNPITVATIFARARALRPDIGATAFEDVTATPAAKGNAPAAPTIENGAELMRRAFAPLRWCVPDLLPEGAYLLAARPKIGKSWLALGIALAIATGERYLGRDIVKGEVLYLALEDNPRRMQSRIKTLRPFEDDGPALADFYYHTEWPRVDQGGAERVKAWLAEHPRARLVIIDTLARVRAKSTRRDGGNSYDDDYAAGQALKAIADAAGVAVLIVTHTRKTEAADPLDLVTGTLGLAGAVDGALVLERARGRDSADLHVIGRDIENEKTWALRFERGAWELLGDAAKIRVSDQRRRILEVLEAEGPQSPKDIASALGARGDAIRQLLRTMRIAGEVEQGTNGQYLLPV